jgi:hypothetical protein
MQSRWGLVFGGVLLAVTTYAVDPAAGQSSPKTRLTPTYAHLCQDEGSVCSRFTTGSVPLWLIHRPLHFPTVRTGETCPVSRGKLMTSSYINGVVFGPGPVRLLVAMNSGNLLAGSVDLLPSDTPGWVVFKTTWIIASSYQGPVIVRAKRIDGPGRVALLAGASAGPLVIPPGPTVNHHLGSRTGPVGTYVSGPGCFAFQVDGRRFHEHIVVDAVGPTAN